MKSSTKYKPNAGLEEKVSQVDTYGQLPRRSERLKMIADSKHENKPIPLRRNNSAPDFKYVLRISERGGFKRLSSRRGTNSKMSTPGEPQHNTKATSIKRKKDPLPKGPGPDQTINQASAINQPKGHRGENCNQESSVKIQQSQKNGTDAKSSTTHPKTMNQSQSTNKIQPVNPPENAGKKNHNGENAHASDNMQSSHNNSQIRHNKMMHPSPFYNQSAYETSPNFPPTDECFQSGKTAQSTQNTEMEHFDANKGRTSSANTYQFAANSAILDVQQNSENAMSVFSNKIDERESNATLETDSNLTISTREEPSNAIIGVSNCLPQLSEAEMERKIDELNSLDERINKLKIEIENYRDGKGHTRYYYLDDQLLKLMYKVDDVKLDRYSPLRKNKLQLNKDLERLDDLLKTKA